MRSIFVILALWLSVGTAQAQQQPMKEWTFLVFLNADNNLYRYGLLNLQQMEQIGSTNDMNIVVEMDHAPREKPTQRLYVQKGQSQVIETLGETNMGDWKHLAEFVTWGMKNFPAKRYALVMWNHGAGWEGISYDDNPHASIRIPDMAQALRQVQANMGMISRRQGPVLDILNFDACLMSGLETAYELKDLAGIMIGSQYNEPGAGEDYSAVLRLLATNPRTEPRALAEHMVYEYVRLYPNSREINYLAIDMSKIAAFTQLFRGTAAQHLGVPSDLQRNLHRMYRSVEGRDLIGGLTGARALAPAGSPLAESIEQVINAYGYPSETAADVVRGPAESGGRALKVTRSFPATVWYRMNVSSPNWQKAVLQRQADGQYSVSMPWPAQYMVRRNFADGREGAGSSEALATFLRNTEDPVVFHNKFPPSSPVIAEAHNLRTKGATGLSLYYTSSGMAARDTGPAAPQSLRAEYTRLQFATVGAPEWTRFIGY